MNKNIADISVRPNQTLREIIYVIDKNAKGIALVVDDRGHLLGTISDGDVRRAILAELDLNTTANTLLIRKVDSLYPKPITAHIGSGREEVLALIRQHALLQIPILDDDGCVVELMALKDLVSFDELPLRAVIMAGGLGARLRPLTDDLPKPMLPLGGKPIMERIIGQLQQVGIRHINVATHYMSEKIIEYFGNGDAFGVELSYVNEEYPLGTGGALGLMPIPQEPVLVINGDILTHVNFRAMHLFHQEHKADLTIAVRRYEVSVPYGVIECEGEHVKSLQEKPQVGFLVNAGIYLLEPSVYQYIPRKTKFNMTDLIQLLLDDKRTVVSFPVHEYWLDIGQHADYTQAQNDVKNGRLGE